MSPDVYILKDGLPAYQRTCGEQKMGDMNVTAGFLQAIMQFSKAQVGENLEAISMSDSLFYFSTKKEFAFILRMERNSPKTRDEIAEVLNQLADKFFEEFPAAEKWDGRDDYFNTFNIYCDDILLSLLATPASEGPEETPAELPAENLVPIPTVIIDEASKQLCGLIDSANASLEKQNYEKARDDYESAIRLLLMVPELEPYYPNLKTQLEEQSKNIDALVPPIPLFPEEYADGDNPANLTAANPESTELVPVPLEPPSHCPFCNELIKDGKCTFCSAWVCATCGQVNSAIEFKCKRCQNIRIK
ncbi:MAG TPA: hypothetical protein VKK79_12670 [Candidatus Lokiarchaeia archaeon]|nr:hypothetical protein [Candidatus Lokiarchaeia archaeon]